MDSQTPSVTPEPFSQPTVRSNSGPFGKIDRSGQQLGNYRLLRLLAKGGFAEVYLGEHIHLSTHAAIKILHTQLASEDMDEFRNEARIIARLRHPHIVSILDFDVEDGTPFLVMDYAPNGTLRQRHLRGTILPPATILSYIKQVAEALQYAHDEHFIHRDIKPENMLIGQRNDILLSDFGIAIVSQGSRVHTSNDVMGTITYMAPEQLHGKPRPASDQYALGVVTYEWLCGECPFRGSIGEIAAQHLNASPPSLHERNSTISPLLEQVVLKALAKDYEQRYPTILDFINAFEDAYQHQPLLLSTPATEVHSKGGDNHLAPTQRVYTVPLTVPGEVMRKQRITRRNVLLGLVGLATVGMASGSIAWHSRTHPTHPSAPVPTPTPIPVGAPLLIYHGHYDAVTAIAWSPGNGSYIASGSKDRSVHVWTTNSGTDIYTYAGHTDTVYAVAWAPDGRHVASGSADKTVQVWNALDGTNPSTYKGHSDVVLAATWSPDSKCIASGSADKTVQVWNAADGSSPYTYTGHSDVISSVAWSPDGNHIASGSADKTVQVWNATDGSTPFTYHDHSDVVNTLAWSPHGTYIASGSSDKSVRVWEAATGKLLSTYRGHGDIVESLSWSTDGSHIVSGSADGIVSIWSASNGSEVYKYQNPSPVDTVAWAPTNTSVAFGGDDRTVQVLQAG